MTVKTDRKDACGLAQLLPMGWFQPVHAKLPVIEPKPAPEIRPQDLPF